MVAIPRKAGWQARCAGIALLVGLGAGCVVGDTGEVADSGPGSSPSPPTTSRESMEEAVARLNRHDPSALLPGASWIATAALPQVAVYPVPDAPEASYLLDNPDGYGTPLVFLVDGPNAEGPWLPVALPVRPNGTKGWVRSGDVTLAQTQYRITVYLTEHRMDITQNGQMVITTPVGVGKDGTPTPGGSYYIKELLEPPDPNTVYGPFVFGLSGFSNVIMSFGGVGQGVIGIHGNNDPASIGTDASHGCIRVPNEVITQMTTFLPLGTPVDIVP
jgi:lipoprotein-anchoring transpeptidase ErfK/SrfK